MEGASEGAHVIVTVDASSPVPPYEQLRGAIAQLVATGQLPVGSRLPTVRQLAADLGLAPGTVARSYRELEAEGVLVTRGRHGTHVAAAPPPPPRAERQRRLAEAANAYAVTVRTLGVDAATALDLVNQALATA
jgi:DNA-binding transcriptional regulator YhcF (GntR family)